MKRLALLLLLPLHLATAAEAPRPANPLSGLLAAPNDLIKAREPLGLSDEQVAKLREIHEARFPQYREKAEAVGEAQRALRDVLATQPIDEKEAGTRFEALMRAEAAVKEIEFRALLAARVVLTPEQVEKMRAHAPGPQIAVKEKFERLKALVGERERAGRPPREHEQAFRELEKAMRDKDAARAEQIVDALLRALSE